MIEPGRKVTKIETFTRNMFSMVRVTTDDGAQGWGQVSTYNNDLAATVLHRSVARHFLGRGPADIDAIVDRVIEANYKFPWSYVNRALSGVDTAVWDLYGKIRKQPVVALLGRVLETKALRRTALNLLDTYLGHDAGKRILGGQIKRGDMETIHAVLWYCDLRGFTALSETLPGNEVIELLNDYFQAMASAVHEAEGEVLKFVGDAMLAIFRPRFTETPRCATCGRALAAAEQAVENLAAVNAERREQGKPELTAGLALHVGEVLYGNVGAEDRLDFTVIGPAVNLVSRIEHLCADQGIPLVVSADFAALLERPVASLGRHELRGIAEAQEIFAPA